VTSVIVWIDFIFVNFNKKMIFASCLCFPIFPFVVLIWAIGFLVYCSLCSSRENNSQIVRCFCFSQTVSAGRIYLRPSVVLCVRLGWFLSQFTSHRSSVLPAHEFVCSVLDIFVQLGALVGPCELLLISVSKFRLCAR
jgi:hypothetical protein